MNLTLKVCLSTFPAREQLPLVMPPRPRQRDSEAFLKMQVHRSPVHFYETQSQKYIFPSL